MTQPDLFLVASTAGVARGGMPEAEGGEARRPNPYFRPRAPETLARRGDPETSLEAARKIVSSGTDAAQCERVLEALRRYPNHTSADLAKLCGMDRYIVARRLPELQAAGLARIGGKTLSHSTGKSGMAWWPA